MPQPSYFPLNQGFSAGQHYRRTATGWDESERKLLHRLMPTRHYPVGGMCAGLVLSWVRRVHTTGDVGTPPDNAEGMSLQYVMYFADRGSRQLAIEPDGEFAEEQDAEMREYAMQSRPTSQGVRARLLKAYRATGMFSVYRGESTPLGIHRALVRHGSPTDGIKTYLLTAQGHATALAVSRDDVALYDPNRRGVVAFKRGQALDSARRLQHMLNNWVSGGSSRDIAVTELAYFSGINKKHFGFGQRSRGYRRDRGVAGEDADAPLGFLTDLWGATEE